MRVNAHTHIYSGLVPLGMPAPKREPQNFVEILQEVWWVLDRAIDRDILQASASYYVANALALGCGGLIDHHESPNFIENSLDVLADSCQEMGMPAVLCYGATERNGGRQEAQRGLGECRRFLQENKRPLVRGAIGLHASFTVSNETLAEAGELCREFDTVLHLHVAEDGADVSDAKERGFDSLLARLDAFSCLEAGSIFAHGVHLSAEEVKSCAERGIWLVQNPRSNEGNGVGYPLALSHSSLVGLGTDGYEADMKAEAAALMRLGGDNGDDLAAAELRIDGSEALFTSFFDGKLPQAGSPLSDRAMAEVQERAQGQAKRLWQRMDNV